MMKCKDVERDLIFYYYGEIEPSAEAEVKTHLETCNRCLSSWERLKSALDITDIIEPELPDSFWQNYRRKIYQKIKDKKPPIYFGVLKPRFVQLAAVVLVILLIGLGGKMYKTKKEQAFITKNYELIKNFELFENLEVLQNLEEIETIKEI